MWHVINNVFLSIGVLTVAGFIVLGTLVGSDVIKIKQSQYKRRNK